MITNVNSICVSETESSRMVCEVGTCSRKLPLRIVAIAKGWRKRRHYRRELRRLLKTGEHLVRDMGLGVDEALHEASKPFYVE